MNRLQIERNLRKIRNKIPVNEALKKNLLESFAPQRKKRSWHKGFSALAACAAVTCLVFVISLQLPLQNVSAEALKIENLFSFVDIGSGSAVGICESSGTIYIPIAGKGLFAYDKNGLHRVYNKQVSSVSVSKDGKLLAFSTGSGIDILNLETGDAMTILSVENENTVYENPSFSPDGKALLYTKTVVEPGASHGFTAKEQGIYEVQLDTLQPKKIADGSYGSYVPNGKSAGAIIYQKENRIILKSSKDGTEQEIDSGRFPAVSPSGTYVAYVKTEESTRVLAQYASVHEAVDNVWIADLSKSGSKKQTTSNYAYAFTNENEWLKSLKISALPQVLSFSGLFSYYNPAWSSDEKSLYVLKNANTQGSMKITRIDFSTEKQTADQTVRRYLQALTVRDDDYAKALMKNPPAVLTISNPHQVGYKIKESGVENSRNYVDADVYWAYTASPYYQVVSSRYYLSESDNGFAIDDIAQKEAVTVYAKGQSVWIEKNGSSKEAFSISDIPSELAETNQKNLVSLCYNNDTSSILFAAVDFSVNSNIEVYSYDCQRQTFTKIDSIHPSAGQQNLGVSKMLANASGTSVSLDLYAQEGESWKGYVVVYDINSQTAVNLEDTLSDTEFSSINSFYWDDDKLVYSVSSDEQSMNYEYTKK